MVAVERKRITVSPKRQITIPIEFFNKLNIGKEVECLVEGNSIIIMPVNTDNSFFAEEILKDLISQGMSGEKLLEEFKKQNKEMNLALNKYLDKVDKDLKEGKLLTTEEIFGNSIK